MRKKVSRRDAEITGKIVVNPIIYILYYVKSPSVSCYTLLFVAQNPRSKEIS